ncbi:hypothetical protein EYC58_04815 [Candidatus Saccharibacteria bacterium]|nr:MAG: hypothetical protein EYC58_04815 [Candidatus Saccharibacteria bacterium]
MKRTGIAAIVAVLVVGAVVCWMFVRPSGDSATPPVTSSATPVLTETDYETSPVDPVDMNSAKQSADVVLRAYFASPTPGANQDLHACTTGSFLEKLQAEWSDGVPTGTVVKVDSVTISDETLPHTTRQIVLSSTVRWSVHIDNEKVEDNNSIAIVTLVKDGGWLVSGIEEIEGDSDNNAGG